MLDQQVSCASLSLTDYPVKDKEERGLHMFVILISKEGDATPSTPKSAKAAALRVKMLDEHTT